MKKEKNGEPIKNNEKKEISNKKAIITIVAVILLLIILIVVYAMIFREDSNNCNNIIIRNNSNSLNFYYIDAEKPIIYLYPEKETKVSVKLGNPQNLTHTYPKYENGWEVIAKPDGKLIDTKTGRKLYALYWEGINAVDSNMNEGFIIRGEDTIKFLEEKLEVLGLNEIEAEEFVIYWLPKLESNKYNFIRFQTEEEINKNMPLEISPKPDTIIRIMMEFKGLEEPIKVREQKIVTPERTGFTVVEWGGTEIN